jgi:hypothetical protein
VPVPAATFALRASVAGEAGTYVWYLLRHSAG